MSLTDEDRALIEVKITTLAAKQDKYNIKSQEIDQVKTGFYILLSDTPKNTDCTDMSPAQIQSSKDNLIEHTARIMEWAD